MLRVRVIFWIFIFTVIMTTNLGALLPNLRLCNPYFSVPGKVEVGFSSGVSDFQHSLFLYEKLFLFYGVNENALFGIYLPVLIYPEVESGMSFGDSILSFKAVLFRSSDLRVQLMWNIDVRMATGVIQEDGVRRLGTKLVSFYPVSTGNSAIIPGLTLRFLIEKWLLAAAFEYQSVNRNGDDLFTLKLNGDRLAFKTATDYYFKFKVLKQKIVFRPAFYFNSIFNLSSDMEVSDDLIATLEFNIKWIKIMKFSLAFSQTLLSKDADLNRDISLTLQKLF